MEYKGLDKAAYYLHNVTDQSHYGGNMLKHIHDKAIKEESQEFRVSTDGIIHAKTVRTESLDKPTALYIHGGGSGGNHSMLTRAARYLVAQGIFSRVILPDRRGSGKSSALERSMTFSDNAADMQALLDAMGVHGSITAMGISYSGPIALTLAAIDPRVNRVILVASSASLRSAKGLKGFLYRTNLLKPIIAAVYGKLVGSLPPSSADFDPIYDASSPTELKAIFMDAIKSTPKERLESLLLENASTLDLSNQSIPENLEISVPVLKVIGELDEIWQVEEDASIAARIPHLKTVIIQKAKHQDCFFRADEFYQAICVEMETVHA